VDLDTGVMPTDPKDSHWGSVDVWFEAVSTTERYFDAYNGATWAIVGPSAVDYAQCRALNPTEQRVDINTVGAGTYICVQTNAGNTSIVRINSIDYSPVGSLRIDFTTWQQP
jgi:hypothetical protein